MALDLSHNIISVDSNIVQVFEAKLLVKLNLSRNLIEKIDCKVTAPLKFINLSRNKIQKLSSIQQILDIETLEGLSLRNNIISDITRVNFIQCNLIRLEMTGNKFKPIEMITQAQNAKNLSSLWLNRLNDKIMIKDIKPINKLDLNYLGVIDLQQLNWIDTGHVTKLIIDNNDFRKYQSFDVILRLPNLQILSMQYCNICTLGLISISPTLSELNVSNNDLISADSQILSLFPRIHKLQLAINKIIDFDFPENGFRELVVLNLGYNNCTDASMLNKLFILKTLKSLSVCNNPFHINTQLPKFVSNLEEIDISHSNIVQNDSAIALLQSTKSLMRVTFGTSYPYIQTVNLKGMVSLCLKSCNISAVKEVAFAFSIPKLEELDLSNNCIGTLCGLLGGKSLKELYLVNNRIRTVNDLGPIRGMLLLKVLILNDNDHDVQPVECTGDKNEAVITAFPQLMAVVCIGRVANYKTYRKADFLLEDYDLQLLNRVEKWRKYEALAAADARNRIKIQHRLGAHLVVRKQFYGIKNKYLHVHFNQLDMYNYVVQQIQSGFMQ